MRPSSLIFAASLLLAALLAPTPAVSARVLHDYYLMTGGGGAPPPPPPAVPPRDMSNPFRTMYTTDGVIPKAPGEEAGVCVCLRQRQGASVSCVGRVVKQAAF